MRKTVLVLVMVLLGTTAGAASAGGGQGGGGQGGGQGSDRSTCAQAASANSARGQAAVARRLTPGNTGGLADVGSEVAFITGDVARACGSL